MHQLTKRRNTETKDRRNKTQQFKQEIKNKFLLSNQHKQFVKPKIFKNSKLLAMI